jgi:hypothetical protein
MLNGHLKEPYAAATIDAVADRDALRSAKEWAAVVEGTDGSWLEVRHNGKCIKIRASFNSFRHSPVTPVRASLPLFARRLGAIGPLARWKRGKSAGPLLA